MMRCLVIVLALAAGGASAASPSPSVFDHPATAAELAQTLAPLTGTLRKAQTLRGTFTQRKTLKDLPKPLLAEGTFLFVRERGIVWRTTVPFASELVITRDALLQRDGSDAPGQRLSADNNPAVRQVSAIFMAVFGLDFAALDRMFALHVERRGTRWTLGLRPRAAEMAGAMQDIVLEGAAQVSRVTLRDTRGDVTEISLHDTLASDSLPGADVLKLFSP
jgi:hypothetical protein